MLQLPVHEREARGNATTRPCRIRQVAEDAFLVVDQCGRQIKAVVSNVETFILETERGVGRYQFRDGMRGEQTGEVKEEWRDVAQSGQRACISNEVFVEWFPPGIDDARARLAARAFAEYYGMWRTHVKARAQVCLILNNPG